MDSGRVVSDKILLSVAYELIKNAVDIMTVDQLSKWEGVRAWIEKYGEKEEEEK